MWKVRVREILFSDFFCVHFQKHIAKQIKMTTTEGHEEAATHSVENFAKRLGGG